MSEIRKAVMTLIQTKVVELNPDNYPNMQNPTPKDMISYELMAFQSGELDTEIIMDGAPSELIIQLL